MKKYLIVLSAAAMVLGVAACSKAPGSGASAPSAPAAATQPAPMMPAAPSTSSVNTAPGSATGAALAKFHAAAGTTHSVAPAAKTH